MGLFIDLPVHEIRMQNRRQSKLFNLGAGLARTFLPAGYTDYAMRVSKWRAALESAGEYLENERMARLKANIVLSEAATMEQSLRAIEAAMGWKRPEVMP